MNNTGRKNIYKFSCWVFIILFSCCSAVFAAAANDQQPAADQQPTTTGQQNLQQLLAGLKQQREGSATAQQQTQQLAAAEQPSIDNEAFATVLQQQLPLTAEQIAILRKAFLDSRKAAASTPDVPPRPTISSVAVDLSAHAAPPIIRLGAGYISSLVFVDSTGQPWPISAYSIGNPDAYDIQWNKSSNTLLVQAKSFYTRSNLAVILEGLDTPVMTTLLPGQKAVDYRTDLRIPGFGPNALVQTSSLPSAADPMLLKILNGIPPKGAVKLKVLGGETLAKAWLLNDKLYLRTSLDIISPGWTAIMSSIDGTHAYELPPASVVLALQHGKDHMLKLMLAKD